MLCEDIVFLADRGLWETKNLITCVPEECWYKRYDGIPMWKYIYHMLYSMDRWYINPKDENYKEPKFHMKTLADLNVIPKDEFLSKEQLMEYLEEIKKKIQTYNEKLTDADLSTYPPNCDFSRFRLILGQFRHWHRHMGIIYGFLIQDTGKWPYVLNMMGEYPTAPMPNYYD